MVVEGDVELPALAHCHERGGVLRVRATMVIFCTASLTGPGLAQPVLLMLSKTVLTD